MIETLKLTDTSLSTNPIHLNPGDIIAKAETVLEIDPDSVNERHSIDWSSMFPLTELNESQRQAAYQLFTQYQSVFAFSKDDIGQTDVLKHAIETSGNRPIKQPYRRLPQPYKDKIDEELSWLTKKGIVRPSYSPWTAPVVMVKKKD